MFTPTQLTQRQSEIVHLAMNGKSNKEIAKTLGISDYTARDTINKVLHLFNLRRRNEFFTIPQLIHFHQQKRTGSTQLQPLSEHDLNYVRAGALPFEYANSTNKDAAGAAHHPNVDQISVLYTLTQSVLTTKKWFCKSFR